MTTPTKDHDHHDQENDDDSPSKIQDKEWKKPGGKEEDDDNDEEDEEDEDDDDSFWTDLSSSWQQHSLAMLIGIVAAVLGYNHLSSTGDAVHLWNEITAGTSHEHVHTYQRTASLHFCMDNHHQQQRQASPNLLSMEFQVPKEMLSQMEHHYRVDSIQEQARKSHGIQQLLEAAKTVELTSPQFHCLQQSPSSKSYFPGRTLVYETPSIQSIANEESSATKKVQAAPLSFSGFAAKFFNLSPRPVLLHWDGRGGHDKSKRLVAEIPPMEAVGTATTPGQSFHVTPVYDTSHALQRWVLTADTALVVYEDADPAKLSPELAAKHKLQKLNLQFARDYLVATGRPWLANFPRPPPMHLAWPANYIGHTRQIISSVGHYQKGQDQQPSLDLSLRVESVAPRVFSIDNFLSDWECQHLIHLAQEKGLHASTVLSGSVASEDTTTRSSTNTWLERHQDFVTDAIYRRAADAMGLDESLFRHRSEEHLEIPTHHSIAESLQVVRYRKDQEYTPHHDFTYPPVADRYQPSRFATLLLYLQAPEEGGETTFPRAVQTTRHDGLVVTPQRGKALLFYHVLPDGNMDDLSQHGSNPVIRGEKWVANLWVWDPIIG